jgi:hypothetical protein
MLASCGNHGDTVEQRRELSLRLAHSPPGRVSADQDAVLDVLVESTLENARVEATIHVLTEGPEEGEDTIPVLLDEDGRGSAVIPGRPRGETVRYFVQAGDAAVLVVTLPPNANADHTYTLHFVGPDSRLLGAISALSAAAGLLLFLGAAAAGVQNLRRRMSAGPAGLLGGVGTGLVVLGLLGLGGIHAWRLLGWPWPSDPLFLSLSRGDFAVISAAWTANLVLGRAALLEEDDTGHGPGERSFSAAAVGLGVLTLVLLLF